MEERWEHTGTRRGMSKGRLGSARASRLRGEQDLESGDQSSVLTPLASPLIPLVYDHIELGNAG